MKLDFRDKINTTAVNLDFSINNDRDISHEVELGGESEIKWSLKLDVDSWGLVSFNYELIELVVPVLITRTQNQQTIERLDVIIEIKPSSSKKKRGYLCRIYEDIITDGVWSEEEYAEFDIKLVVEESPTTEMSHRRSQIFVKYIDLELSGEDKQLTLTI